METISWLEAFNFGTQRRPPWGRGNALEDVDESIPMQDQSSTASAFDAEQSKKGSALDITRSSQDGSQSPQRPHEGSVPAAGSSVTPERAAQAEDHYIDADLLLLSSPEEASSPAHVADNQPLPEVTKAIVQARLRALGLEDSEEGDCDLTDQPTTLKHLDGLVEELMGTTNTPTHDLSCWMDDLPQTGVSYLDPDFDLGIPSIAQHGKIAMPDIGTSPEQATQGGKAQELSRSLTDLKTCSEDGDCVVRPRIHSCIAFCFWASAS